jgi:hypothetical protein
MDKILGSIIANYRRAAFFTDLFPDFRKCFEDAAACGKLSHLNEALIQWIRAALNIDTPCIRASDLAVGGCRGEHLARICERVSATNYLSTPGSREYLIEDKATFDDRGIAVFLHAYEHPVYPQLFDPFAGYATALDLIFNVGPVAGDIMREGRRPRTELI